MLETILKLYTMYMAYDTRSPMPHLIGPPGAGKSTVAQQAADLIGVNLHIINVARLSPLEVEGVQMPVDMDTVERRLELLLNEMWASLREGDIVLMDEFLRGFPEVYNAILDIFTSRQVRGHKLPKVFIMGASNSSVAYDAALEDRLLHIPVADPRTKREEYNRLVRIFIDALGLHPDAAKLPEMKDLFNNVVLPMFNVLDSYKSGSQAPTRLNGHSVRNLIGQVQLRHVVTDELTDLIEANNRLAMREGKEQYVVLLSGKNPPKGYVTQAARLPDGKLTPVQRLNKQMNLELIEMQEQIANRKETPDDSHVVDFD